MTPTPLASNNILHSNRTRMAMFMYLAVFLAMIVPGAAMAQADGGTGATTCVFFQQVSMVLNTLSVIVVTIAIVFTGYKVAFAHARISEVAPVLIGAILIGAASQIAKLFLNSSSTQGGGTQCSTSASIVTHALQHYAAVVHMLAHYA